LPTRSSDFRAQFTGVRDLIDAVSLSGAMSDALMPQTADSAGSVALQKSSGQGPVFRNWA
jgi:hypothetical protein